MKNKQIIDGVDVSGCNFTLERDGKIKCECCHATGFGVICDCESWKTCDYKNYKLKEQECEKLKKQLIKCDDNIIVDCEYSKKDLCSFIHRKEEVINGLQQQLDQLEEQITYQRNFIESLLLATNNSEWLDKSILDDEASEIIEKIEMDYVEFEEGKEIKVELKAENEKLKQNLTKIKDIAEPYCNYCEEKNRNRKNCKNCEYGEYKKIIDIINEVLNA